MTIDYGKIMAVVEPLESYGLDAAAVRTHLRAHLAGYKAPRSVEIRREICRARIRGRYSSAACATLTGSPAGRAI